MVMSYFWALCMLFSAVFSIFSGSGAAVTAALTDGAVRGVEIAISIAGPLCLWAGIAELMERTGLSAPLVRLLAPILRRLFPTSTRDPELAGALSANVCANLLGLGNAATPMGIRAVQRLRDPNRRDLATDEMCRLVVMNTASIQLLPTTVAAVRQSAGCASPFDILPCVWVSSIVSVTAGLTAAYFFGRLERHA